jgi:hypothetical protein
MNAHSWCVRIGDGTGQGSGFLISPRLVLTCRHVADHWADPQLRTLTVWFGYLDREFGAKIVFESEAGDVAVLELFEEPPVRPATFAPLSVLDVRVDGDRPQLSAIGYPRDFTRTGKTALFVALDSVGTPGGETPVMKSERNHSGILEGGYSGAAVFKETGEVVGMVVQADRAKDGSGLILSLSSILNWWPGLDEHLRLGERFDAGAYRRLRELLEPLAAQTSFEDLAGQFSKVPNVRGRYSTLAVIEYLVTEMGQPDDEIETVLFHLLSKLKSRQPSIAGWINEHLVNPRPAVPVPVLPGSMMVRIVRSARGTGNRYDVTVFQVDPEGSVLACVERLAVPRDRVREDVETVLLKLFQPFDLVDHSKHFVEFVMPPSWFHEPVEFWQARHHEDLPLGVAHPVTLRDFNHFTSGRPGLEKSWAKLSSMPSAVARWQKCPDLGTATTFHLWLLKEETVLVGLAPMPAAGLLEKAVSLSVPALLWSRAPCDLHRGDGATGACGGTGFEVALTRLLGEHRAEEIPMMVRQLRIAAALAEDATGCGSSIAVMWNDPRRRPRDMALGMPEAAGR